MNFIRRFYEGTISVGSFLQHFLLLVLRLYWGFSFFQAGSEKLHHVTPTASFFQGLGIPFPEMNVYLVGGVEMIGGLLLLFGFASRLAAIPLAITMIVALLTAHIEVTKQLVMPLITIYHEIGEFLVQVGKFVKEPPFNYLLVCLIIFCFGPGNLSLDFCLEKLFSRRGR